MRPSFNTAGPCLPGEHYMLDPLARVPRARQLIEDGKFFTLTAGRQTGKTTCAMSVVDAINREQRRQALWVDVQAAREQPAPPLAFRTILNCFDKALQWQAPHLQRPDESARERWLLDPATALHGYLTELCSRSQLPLVLLLDEADGLVGPAMVSFLTQLRDGYIARSKQPFPHSVVLVGMRAVRDYVISSDERRTLSWLGTTSPFNITVEAQTLAPFTRPEIASLLEQHTALTGQPFEPRAAELIAYFSQGQPWLVNALADVCVDRLETDRGKPVTWHHVEQAKELLIVERRTHIDSLLARLREERVRRVIEPMMTGAGYNADVLDDDVSYAAGLGLIRVDGGRARIANPIYREVIPRALTYVQQISLDQETTWYLRDDGTLDVGKLMAAWQKFWRKDGHLAAEGFSYREAGPHLMLMAFLQRIVNGGGKIEREYALGKGALDLLIEWKAQRIAIECKLRRDESTEEDGLEQLGGYLQKLGLDEGWLVLFDLRKEVSWADKLFTRTAEREGRRLHVVGC